MIVKSLIEWLEQQEPNASVFASVTSEGQWGFKVWTEEQAEGADLYRAGEPVVLYVGERDGA